MSDFYQKLTQGVLVAGSIIAAAPSAWATSFTVANGETLTSTQTLVDNETGLIESGGFIVVESNEGVKITGDNATVTNDGTIDTTGGGTQAIEATGEMPSSPTMARLSQTLRLEFKHRAAEKQSSIMARLPQPVTPVVAPLYQLAAQARSSIMARLPQLVMARWVFFQAAVEILSSIMARLARRIIMVMECSIKELTLFSPTMAQLLQRELVLKVLSQILLLTIPFTTT